MLEGPSYNGGQTHYVSFSQLVKSIVFKMNSSPFSEIKHEKADSVDIAALQQNGHSLLRPHFSDQSPASNLTFNEAVRKMRESGRNVYHFGFGQAPFPVLEGAKKALAEHAGENIYLPVEGLAELRANICSFHGNLDKLTGLNKDLVIVGPGSKELIYLLINVFNGDILILSPTWVTYKPQAVLANQKVFTIESSYEDEWKLTPKAVEKVMKENSVRPNKLLILCYPDNPTGTSYDEQELIALSNTFRKHNITVISDEIYGRIHFQNNHKSLVKYYPEGTILTSGLSKWASAGGWRLGYSIYPRELEVLYKAVCSAASQTYSCASAPIQHAAIWIFRLENETEEYIFHTTRILHAAANYCHRELTSVGVRAVTSKGGFYLFPDFEVVRGALARRGITTGEAMCKALLEEADVAVMSGGPSFLRPAEELTVRLCFVNFDGAIALKASKLHGDEPITDEFLNLYCKPVVDGIQAIVKWVHKQLNSSH